MSGWTATARSSTATKATRSSTARNARTADVTLSTLKYGIDKAKKLTIRIDTNPD